MTAEEFLEGEKGKRRSVLEPFQEDLRKLRDAGLSYQRMTVFLAANGVEISVAGLSAYMRRHGLAIPEVPTSQRQKAPTTATPTRPKASSREPATGSPPPAPDVFELSKKPEVDMSFDT